VATWTWIAAEDKRTCLRCSPLDGQIFLMEVQFPRPPLHPNCRCDFGLPEAEFERLREELAALDAAVDPEAAASAGGTPPSGPSGGEPPGSGKDGGGGVDGDLVPHNPEWEGLVRQQRWEELEGLAASHRLTPEEYEEQVNAHLKGLLEEMEPWTRTDPALLLETLRDGEFKNQFDTGTSGGVYNPGLRRQTEAALWAIPEDAPGAARPKYGYLHTHPDGVTVDTPEGMDQYGTALVRFKSTLREQTTFDFTGGDTLDDTLQGTVPTIAPARVTDPRWTALRVDLGDLLTIQSADDLIQRAETTRVWYIEAQYHGRVSTEEVAEVVFLGATPTVDLQGALAQRAIPWRVLY
jgi:hypothetical protein